MRWLKGAAAALVGLCLAGCGPRFLLPGATVTTPHLEGAVFVPRDGARLPLHRWAAAGSVRGVVLGLHSYGDYGRAFAGLGPDLAAAGYTVLAPDLRGFGATASPGRWPGTAAFVDDLADLVTATRAASPAGRPIWIIGESLGGGIALAAAGRNVLSGIRGLVLASPAVREGIAYRYAWNVGLWSLAAAFPGHEEPIDQLDPDLTPRAARRLNGDPLVQRRIRLDTYYGLIRLADAASDAAPAAHLPVLLLYGTADTSVRPVSICALIRELPGPLTTRIYPGGIHRILHQAGNHADVTAAVLAFLGGDPVPAGGTEDAAALCKDRP